MARADRKGKANRHIRTVGTRTPDLGYYVILTDGKETERNYLEGVKDSLPEKYKDRLVIKVIHKPTKDLLSACQAEQTKAIQYGTFWLMLDRDQVPDFDKLIKNAARSNIHSAWSNPCIEVWFQMHWAEVHAYSSSESCIREFSKSFKDKMKKEYKKENKSIYKILHEQGKEQDAVARAEKWRNHFLKDNPNCPCSEMNPCSSIDALISEIRRKTEG